VNNRKRFLGWLSFLEAGETVETVNRLSFPQDPSMNRGGNEMSNFQAQGSARAKPWAFFGLVLGAAMIRLVKACIQVMEPLSSEVERRR